MEEGETNLGPPKHPNRFHLNIRLGMLTASREFNCRRSIIQYRTPPLRDLCPFSIFDSEVCTEKILFVESESWCWSVGGNMEGFGAVDDILGEEGSEGGGVSREELWCEIEDCAG